MFAKLLSSLSSRKFLIAAGTSATCFTTALQSGHGLDVGTVLQCAAPLLLWAGGEAGLDIARATKAESR